MKRTSVATAFGAALLTAIGCNGILGLDEVSERALDVEDAGAKDASTKDGDTDATAGHAGAAGSSGLLACGTTTSFDSGEIVNGGFESDQPDQAWTPDVIGIDITTVNVCEGTQALRVKGWNANGGRVYNVLTPLPFTTDPCVDLSFWARAPTGEVSFHIWLTFNAEGPTGYAFNDLSPPGGFVASTSTWTRYTGRCKARVPDPIHGYSQVAIRAAKDQTVDIDALAAFAVACVGDEPECPIYK